MANAPYEIIAGPLEAWVAPVGTAFPDVDTAPSAPWSKLGTSGTRSYTEDGVTVQHSQSVEEIRAAGSVGPVKALRTEEGLHVSFTLMDLSLSQYSAALNFNSVSEEAAGAGTPGTQTIGLSRGLSIEERALLLRGTDMSPEGDGMNAQYEIERAVEMGEPEVVFAKGEPAGLALEFAALEDPDAASEDERFGRLVVQSAEAET